MPCPSATEVVSNLGSEDEKLRLQAVIAMKNAIIGNIKRKAAFFSAGAVPVLVGILATHPSAKPSTPSSPSSQSPSNVDHKSEDPMDLGSGGSGVERQNSPTQEDASLVVHAAQALGSFACGSSEKMWALIQAGGVPKLCALLHSTDVRVVAAATRTLKIMLQSHPPEVVNLFAQDSHGGLGLGADVESIRLSAVERLLELVREGAENTSDVAASVLARACQTAEQQRALLAKNAFDGICALLQARTPKKEEAALDFAASLLKDNRAAAEALLQRQVSNMEALMGFVRDRRPVTRLLACTCVASVIVSGAAVPVPVAGGAGGSGGAGGAGAFGSVSRGVDYSHETRSVLYALIKLLGEPHKVILERAPEVLRSLLKDSLHLQRVACESGAVESLVEKAGSPAATAKQKESMLLALGTLSSSAEDLRKLVAEKGAVPLIVEALKAPGAPLRAAGCMCLRSLSRSIHNLRTSIADAKVGGVLSRLLDDGNMVVKQEASAVICNLVIDFSPVKSEIVENGGIQALLSTALSSESSVLRLNALWALRNLTYLADPKTKATILTGIGKPRMLELLRIQTAGPTVVEQAIGLLRNILHDSPEDIDMALDVLGYEELIEAVQGCITESSHREVSTQALYALSNLAAGANHHKGCLIKRADLMTCVLACMKGSDRGLAEKLASVTFLSNLTSDPCPGNTIPSTVSPAANERLLKLRDFGFIEVLNELLINSACDCETRRLVRKLLKRLDQNLPDCNMDNDPEDENNTESFQLVTWSMTGSESRSQEDPQTPLSMQEYEEDEQALHD